MGLHTSGLSVASIVCHTPNLHTLCRPSDQPSQATSKRTSIGLRCEPVAMAATATPSAVSSTSGLSLPSRCHAPVAANTSSASPKLRLSRRLLLPGLVAAPLLLQQQSAFAKDIPLFGIRKRVEQAEKAVENEVKEIVKEGKELVKEGEDLVKEGEKELTAAAAAVVSKPAIDSPPPAYQAAGVAGAELVALLIASSIVNGLVSES